ncbi:Phospholipid-transporting ATPase IB [Thelohanellus kitauei]|uniref:Phospholipid-transporting ATPase n=1 Tax=Thelohanellus kitauei TaxID=669202 RepID=A0A0C2N725_THEKT|nr:Phospholipid-transporting ATPase IB [Thelohanellus kitauei]
MYTRLPPTHDIVNTCSVIEDLGHVNYIFTDKTGTLTRNEMILKEVSIGTKHYFLDETLQSQVTSQTFEEDEQIKLFFMNLLLCNTVISEESQSNAIQFQSSSPDETAIVTALHRYGFKFLQRLHDTIIIECFGRQELWKILVTIEFSSERQRMSVIAKSPSNRNFIFSKGADNAIIQRLKVIGDEIHETTSFYLDFFAKNGLRTLCVAYKELGEVETELAVSNFKDAFVNLEHRQTLIDQASNEIEKDFTLLGCTGIEDLLQDEVCSTISVLREAQIKIWMLTGDKLETAINVGYSSKLLDEEMKLYVLCSESVVEYSNKLNNIINEHNIKVNIDKKVNNTKIPKNIAIILTGKDLKNILTDEVETKFLNVAINCKTVICCRISPSQKKDVVLLVKKRVNDAVALAIGDGANDCSMIRASHVGVGIVGKEGHHAANTADFAIDEYKLLSRLLFVHGASCYRRICNCVYFVFYKNLVFNLLPFFYNFLTLFSGKSVVLKLHFPFFNGVYTTFQPFCFGLLDMTSSSQASTNVPYLYRSVRKSYHFGIRRFTYWCLNATLHSVLIFILCYLSLSNGTLNIYGAPLSDSLFQTFILTHTLLVITLKSVLEIRNWSWVTQLGIWFGFISYVICLIFLSRLFIKPLYMQPQHLDLDVLLISSPAFYITLFIPCMILLPDFLFHW